MSEGIAKVKPKIEEKFIVNIKGKEFITYVGLLDIAHKLGLRTLQVDIIQMPTGENKQTAICRAVATNETASFADIGDANPENTGKMIVPHIIRMASTRAKARALRDFTNVGITALEELGDNAPDKKSKPEEMQPQEKPLTDKELKDLEAMLDYLHENVDKLKAGEFRSQVESFILDVANPDIEIKPKRIIDCHAQVVGKLFPPKEAKK